MSHPEEEFRKRKSNPGRRVTVRDIAAAAGVSATTVSFALRDIPRVSKALRGRILEIAEEMGYVPDVRMSAISRYRKDSRDKPMRVSLAWLNLWEDPERLYAYREFRWYRHGATEAAGRLGYHLEEVVAKGLSPVQLARKLRDRDIQGVLIAPHSNPVIDLERFPMSDFTVVRFGLEMERPVLHSVTANQVLNGELAFRQVRAKGYKRIGFVTEQLQKLPFGAGIYWEQKECPKSERVPLLMYPSNDEKVQMALLADWVESEKPEAIITNLSQVPGMLSTLGFRIPQDIALATTSIHDTPIDAGIDQHPEEIGRVALLTLISLMNDSGQGAAKIQNQTLVEGEWVDGSMLPSRIPGGEERINPERERSGKQPNPQREVANVQSGKRVTQRDIAKAMGVSHVTVSLALRNDPRSAAETRARVQKLAEEMGYVPDPMLTAMGQYCRTTRETPVMAELAWLNLWADPGKLYAYREFEQYWEGALEGARRQGYRLEEFVVKDMPLPRLDKILATRNIRGILVPPSPLPAIADLSLFPWQDYAVVRLGVTCPVPLPYSVAVDDVANSGMALAEMLAKGYQRMAFVGDHAVQRTFGAGFYWAQRMLPAAQRLPLFFLPLKEPARHRNKLAAWIRKERPDAILTDNGALPDLLADLGIRVPDDIALATTTLYDTPIDAGIDHNSKEVGRMGIVSLLAHMKDPGRSLADIRSEVHVKGAWVDGSMMPSIL